MRAAFSSVEWVAAAAVMAFASFVLGLAGFGNGLVAIGLLPWLIPPAQAIVVLTIYTIVFSVLIFLPVRDHVTPGRVIHLIAGTMLGTPLGVWALSRVSASTLTRLIGAVLVLVVLLEWLGAYPDRLRGRWWGLGAGVLAGMAGGAVGTPGPPVVLYSTTQGWSPRTIKANLQVFFFVNQAAILAGYWWVGLVDGQAWRLAGSFVVPAAAGTALGMFCFDRVDQRRFRRIVFGLLLVFGILLLGRG